MIFGKNICHVMRENWLNTVPIILILARECKSSAVVSVLRSYDETGLEDDFGKF